MKATHDDAKYVLRTLRSSGHDSYLAGGCVRDLLLGVVPNDFDVTTSATPDEVQSIFPVTIPVGASFGVVKVVVSGREIDVATFRADGEYSDNRRPDSVTYSKYAREDVTRRDFTINAMLMDQFGEVIDYVGGREDLNNRILRTVGSAKARFGEDALRMPRAIRFATRFNLKIESSTWSAIENLCDTIKNVSAERVTDELTKTFSYGSCDLSYWMWRKSGLWDGWFGHAPRATDNYRAMLGLAKVEAGEPFILPLAIIVTLSTGSKPESILKKLVLTTNQRKDLSSIQERAGKVTEFLNESFSTKRRMMNWSNLELVKKLVYCLSESGHLRYSLPNGQAVADVHAEMSRIKAMGFPQPLVNGNDLQDMGFVAGPVFTKMLHDVQSAQLEGTLDKKGVKAFLLNNFPAAPRKNDEGNIVDGMGHSD